jgi:hypothetical protein
MRKRIAVVVCGLVLAVIGVPAAPALAISGVTCGNLVEYDETPEPIILARTCIAWNDLPSGNRWTLYQSKAWKPPGAPFLDIHVTFVYNDGRVGDTEELRYNETAIRKPNSVGPYTAKFEIWVTHLSGISYCMFMVPGSYHQQHENCNN